MFLNATHFYEVSQRDMWGDSIKPNMMPLSMLNSEIEKALVISRRLYPPSPMSTLGKVINIAALVIVSVAAVYAVAGSGAAAAGGSASGGSSAAAAGSGIATGAGSGTVASSTVAASASGGSISTGSALSVIKTGASYLSKAGVLYRKVTGKTANKDIMSAANFLESSDDVTKMSEKALDYYLAQQGEKITDEKTRALLRERLRREQKIQSARLRKIAVKQQNKSSSLWFLLIPAGFLLSEIL